VSQHADCREGLNEMLDAFMEKSVSQSRVLVTAWLQPIVISLSLSSLSDSITLMWSLAFLRSSSQHLISPFAEI